MRDLGQVLDRGALRWARPPGQPPGPTFGPIARPPGIFVLAAPGRAWTILNDGSTRGKQACADLAGERASGALDPLAEKAASR